MIKTLLFDLDQTLLNRQQSLLHFIDWQFEQLTLLPSQQKSNWTARFVALDQNGKVWKDEVYASLVQEFNIQSYSADELLQDYVENFHQFVVAFPAVKSVLLQLHQQGYRLGLISNGRTPFQERNFQALGIAHLFASVLVSAAINLRKPDPQIFHLACRELDSRPEECIFIGDDPQADLFGAQQTGLYCIHFQPDAAQTCSFADAHIQDFSQLAHAIKQIQQQLSSR